MGKQWLKIQALGLLLIVFVLWFYLTLYPYALLTKAPSEVIPFCKFVLFTAPKMTMHLPLGSIDTQGIESIMTRSQILLRGLFFIKLLISLSVLISGIGLLIKRKEILKLVLYATGMFVILNGLNLFLLIPNYLRTFGVAAMPVLLKQAVITIFFWGIFYYLTRPKVKE